MSSSASERRATPQATAVEINQKQQEAAITEKEIDVARESYRAPKNID